MDAVLKAVFFRCVKCKRLILGYPRYSRCTDECHRLNG